MITDESFAWNGRTLIQIVSLVLPFVCKLRVIVQPIRVSDPMLIMSLANDDVLKLLMQLKIKDDCC